MVVKTLSGDAQRITYARTFDESTGIMSNVTIEEFQNEKLARVQTAKKATWKEDSWVLEDGNVYTVDEKEGVTSKAAFSKQVIPLNITPREINWEQKSINEMTLGELRGYVKVLERQNLPTSDLWTEIFMRFAIPLASLVFALLGAPLGMGISVIVIFVYYGIMAFTTGLGKGGVIPPLLAAMLPNIICLVAGIFLLRRADY